MPAQWQLAGAVVDSPGPLFFTYSEYGSLWRVGACVVDRVFIVFVAVRLGTRAGGALIFKDMDINLTVSAFRVDGDLIMGSQSCPIVHNIIINFFGSRNSTTGTDPVLGVQGGHDFGTCASAWTPSHRCRHDPKTS